MKKNIFNNKLNTEDFIINKYFSKLNFGRFETFNYKNADVHYKQSLCICDPILTTSF